MKIFCYGTLQKDKHNHFLMERATFLGEHHTGKGYTLRVLDNGLPVLLHDGVGPGCFGELYEVDAELLKLLDKFEGHPYMYERMGIEVFDTEVGVFVDGVESYLFPFHPKLERFKEKARY